MAVEFGSMEHEEDEKSGDASAEGRLASPQVTVEDPELTQLVPGKASQVRAMLAEFASM